MSWSFKILGTVHALLAALEANNKLVTYEPAKTEFEMARPAMVLALKLNHGTGMHELSASGSMSKLQDGTINSSSFQMELKPLWGTLVTEPVPEAPLFVPATLPTLTDVRGAVSRGWTSEANSGKTMDPELADAIATEVMKLSVPAELTEGAGAKHDPDAD